MGSALESTYFCSNLIFPALFMASLTLVDYDIASTSRRL